jgi:hypothetical protein
MRHLAHLLFFAPLWACTGSEPFDSNPSGTGFVVGLAPDGDVTIDSARWPGAFASLLPCNGSEARDASLGSVDLLADERLSLAPGTWCAITLGSSEPLQISGTGNDNRFQLQLQLDELELVNGGGVTLEDQELMILLGAVPWPSLTSIPGAAAGDVDLAPGTPQHDQIIEDLRIRTFAFQDSDRDGYQDPFDTVLFAGSPDAFGLPAF